MQSQSAYASYRLTSHASMINGHDYLPIPNYNGSLSNGVDKSQLKIK